MRYILTERQVKILKEDLNLIDSSNVIVEAYTEDEIIRIAKQYKTPTEFRKKSQYIAKLAYKDKDIWDRVTQHMQKRTHVKRSEEDVYAEALKYDYLKDFINNSQDAYRKAIRLGILDKVSKHMKVLEGLSKRVVYAYEFPDNSVYVGLTHNVTDREKQHKERGSVSEHLKETNLVPTLKIISDDYIDPSDAQKMEACTVEEYRQNGWVILNKAKTGSLGACKVFWTRDRVKNLTRNLTHWKEFEKHGGAYDAAYRNGWLNDGDITGHLIRKKTYTEEGIMNMLSQFNSYNEFRQYDNKKLYQAAKERGLLPKIKQWYETNTTGDSSIMNDSD